jgi:hypothetical protein
MAGTGGAAPDYETRQAALLRPLAGHPAAPDPTLTT